MYKRQDKKSRQMIRRVKQQNKDAVVVAVGCYVQVAREKLEEIKDIDLILGTKEKKDIYAFQPEVPFDFTFNLPSVVSPYQVPTSGVFYNE